jgi:hypothetical protein
MTKKQTKTKLAYRIHCPVERQLTSQQFADLELEILIGNTLDAAKEYDANANASYHEYYLDRLQSIRQEGESTLYFSTTSSSKHLVVKWLASYNSFQEYGLEWFAPRLDDTSIEIEYLQLAAKLFKQLERDPSPALVLQVLHKMGAKRVRYGAKHSCWIFQPDATESDYQLPWTRKEPERNPVYRLACSNTLFA